VAKTAGTSGTNQYRTKNASRRPGLANPVKPLSPELMRQAMLSASPEMLYKALARAELQQTAAKIVEMLPDARYASFAWEYDKRGSFWCLKQVLDSQGRAAKVPAATLAMLQLAGQVQISRTNPPDDITSRVTGVLDSAIDSTAVAEYLGFDNQDPGRDQFLADLQTIAQLGLDDDPTTALRDADQIVDRCPLEPDGLPAEDILRDASWVVSLAKTGDGLVGQAKTKVPDGSKITGTVPDDILVNLPIGPYVEGSILLQLSKVPSIRTLFGSTLARRS